MEEERRGENGRIRLRARVWCEDEEITLYVPAVDVSDGGMCVRTGRGFEIGSRVRLGVSGPEGHAVATARVVWSRPSPDAPSIGLQLVAFERGREAFGEMVLRARQQRARLEVVGAVDATACLEGTAYLDADVERFGGGPS